MSQVLKYSVQTLIKKISIPYQSIILYLKCQKKAIEKEDSISINFYSILNGRQGAPHSNDTITYQECPSVFSYQ